jgi:hypothetical protein
MDMHVGKTTDWPTVSFGGLRLWDTGTGWAEINANSTDFANNTFDWANLDSFVSAAQQHGVDVLYNLARTPTWASSNPTDSSCAYASIGGGPGQCHAPADLNSDGTGTDQDWINWVTAVATRYKGQIKYYEIWNEWNIPLFWSGLTPGTQGSVQQLIRMEQDAHCVIEGEKNVPAGSCGANGSVFPSSIGIDPTAQIVTPSPVGAHTSLDAVSNNLSNYFASTVGGYAGGTFADIIGFHAYVGTKDGANLCPTPEDVNTVIDNLNQALPGTPGVGKPWFNTEGGWSKAQSEGFTDPQRQAAFLPRYYLLQASLGLDRVYWYRWDAGQTYTGSLWSPSGGATPAATAFGEVYKWLTNATLITACTPNGTIWTCGFSRPGGYLALAVWDVSQDCTSSACPSTPFNVPAGYTMYRKIDGSGGDISLNGATTVPVGAQPILLETFALPQ